MSPLVAGALISGVSSLAGGAMSQRANMKAAERFAKQGIQWRVEDAKKAGIHPLAALGVPLTGSGGFGGAGDFGASMASAGQDIGRAVMAGQTRAEREISMASAALALEQQGLQNDLLRSQIASMNSAQLPPPMHPQLNPGLGEYIPQGVETNYPGDPSLTPYFNPEVTVTRTQSGGFAVLPTRETAEMLESSGMLSQFQWWIRNNFVPGIGGNAPSSVVDQYPPGTIFRYNIFTGEWKAVDPYPGSVSGVGGVVGAGGGGGSGGGR